VKERNNKKHVGINNNGNSFDSAFVVLSKSIVQVMESSIKKYNRTGKMRFISNLKFSFLKVINVVKVSKTNEILLNA
jgi:hypothetical protein